MPYLTHPSDIKALIIEMTAQPTLWLDTEVADWWTSAPRLSLIQVLADPTDMTGEATYILDVLDRPVLVQHFVEQIMTIAPIEKVFHNASYDLRFLGGRDRCRNVTCTYNLSKKVAPKTLGTTNRKLKTLAKELCQFTDVDQESQSSDWGRRPLSDRQLLYASMDTVYLAHVHRYLLELPTRKPMGRSSH